MSSFKLFLIFLKIGTFGFGGGFAMLSFLQKELVEKYNFITLEELKESISLSQFSPGAMIVNTSANIGYKLKGIKGLFSAVLGLILPSFLIIILLSSFYLKFSQNFFVLAFLKGIYPVLIALLILIIFNLGKDSLKSNVEIFIALFSFIFLKFLNLDPILIIAISGIVGLIFFKDRKCT